MSDRVLDRKYAEDPQAGLEHLDARRLSHRLTAREALDTDRDALRAALDTDREEQVERVARAIEGFVADMIDIGWDRCGSARKTLARLAARRVLSVLEGADDE